MRATVLLLIGACASSGDIELDAALDGSTDREKDAGDTAADPVLAGMWGGYGTAPGQFVEPSSVELDSDGFVYVAGHEDRLQKFTPDGELLAIWGIGGTGEGEFNHPHGLAIDRARGDLVYAGDQENHRVQAFTREGSFVRMWSNDQFKHIHDVGIDPASGDIYVGDYELHLVQKFTAEGRLIAKLGGLGTGQGQFNGVWGISTDSRGDVYVADTFNRRVQKLDARGEFLAAWGSPEVEFEKPTGVFVDAEDVVHVCDSLAETVFRFDTAGTLLQTWNLRTIVGERSEPEDIVIDSSGRHIYIGEVFGHRVFHLLR